MFFRPSLPLFRAFTIALIMFGASTSLAHEFWIEAQEYQVESGAPLIANLRTGEFFSGTDLAYFPKRFQRFDLILGDMTAPVEGRMGDVPAIQMAAPKDGLLVIVHKTSAQTLKYGTWEKFAQFADHKGFENIKTRHDTRGIPQRGFIESYTRFAKTLIGVGDARGADMPTGLETEIVALTNPYTADPAKGLAVRLIYLGAPRSDAQIEVYDRSQDGVVMVTTTRTDDAGQALVPIRAGHSYLLDAVVLREAPEGGEAVWETLWASLTFAVPD